MTALEYRDVIKRLGLTLESAAELQGISEVKSRKRAFGMVSVPPEAAMLLRLMLAMRISPADAMNSVANLDASPPL